MDIERLTARNKNGLAYLVNVKPNEQEVDSPHKNTLKCILDCFERLAQYEEAAIARQSATSEEVQEAIEYFEDTIQYISGEPQEKDHRLAITVLQQYQPWVSVDDRLPEIPEGGYGVMCNVMVDNCSSTKVMSLSYEKNTVRGKTVCRWKWFGRISPWNVTHWKPLPEPPKGE